MICVTIVRESRRLTRSDMLNPSPGNGDCLPFRPGNRKPGMTVVDLTAAVRPSRFQRQGRARECAVAPPGKF